MKKYIIGLLIIFTTIGIFSPLQNVSAADPKKDADDMTSYKFLAPLPNPDKSNTSISDGSIDLKNGALGSYLSMMLKLVIGLAAVLAVLMIAIGGVQYMSSELISGKEAAKGQMTNAVLGLMLALSSWVLLNTINPDLLNSEPNMPDVKVTVIEDSIKQSYNSTTKLYKNGQLFNTPLFGPTATLPPFASVYNGECTFIGQESCTSTRGLDVKALWGINQGCKCNLTITGGTEWWLHGGESGNTSHQSGNSTIDLRRTDALDKYLSGGKPLVKYQRYGPNNEYYFEGDHWHVGP